MADILLGTPYRIFNQYAPQSGALAMRYPLVFANPTVPLVIDLLREQQQNGMDIVQTVFIDNADNPASLSLIFGTLLHRIVAPPFSQGFYPIMAPTPTTFQASTVTAGATVAIHLINVPMPLAVWFPQGMTSEEADLAAFNIAAATQVKVGVGRVFKINVLVAGAPGNVYDSASIAGVGAGNLIAVIPAVVGTYDLNFPLASGLTIVPGAAQVVTVSYD